MITKYFLKSLLSNKAIWGWGVGLMLFWIIMGAYVFEPDMTTKNEWMGYTSVWFSLIGLLSASVIATTVAYSVYYANSSLAYGFRFTRLKPSGYIRDLMISTSIMTGIIGAIITVLTIILFRTKSGYLLIPKFPEFLLLMFFVTGIFMFLLSAVLVMFANNYIGLKSVTLIAFIPQLLSFLFGLSEIGTSLPNEIVYGSPFTDIARIMYQTYYGKASPLNFSNATSPTLNPYIMMVSLIFWIALLFVLAMFLIRRIKAVSIEGGRQV